MNWTFARLDEVAKIVGGATPSTAVSDYWHGDVLWATPVDLSELSSRYISDTPRKITHAGLRSCGAEVLPANSVLLSSRAPIGHVAINLAAMATNQGFKSIVPDASRLLSGFVYWWLKANKSYLQRLGNGATFKEISKAVVSRIQIPVPPLNEQRRLAAILDQADDLRRRRRLALEKLDALPQAIFQEMFGDPVTNPKGWPRAPLGDLIDIHGGWSPVCLDRSATSEEWGVLKLSAITSCTYDDRENKALPSSMQQRVALEVMPGDVLFSRKNTYQLVGACAYVSATRKKLAFPDLIFRLRPRQNSNAIVGRYLHALLIASNKRRQIQALAGGAAGSMPNISMGRLSALDIEVPPISLQSKFASILEKIEISRQSSIAHDATVEQLFGSLQHRAFSGELIASHSATALAM